MASPSAQGNLTTTFSNSSAAYHILYRTTNSHYQPFWAVTTLLVPKQTDGSALLSYQIPYNTADVDGSASVLLYEPITDFNALTANDIQTSLSKGWYVNVPDYAGPLTSFGAGVLEGQATLDSIRATRSAVKGLNDARIALWGYSGGSIASEWASELHAAYAPELNIVGAALGGQVPNITSIIPKVTATQFAGLLPEVTLGLFSQYPDAMSYLLSQLHKSGAYNGSSFLQAKNLNIEQAFAYYANQSMYDYFSSGSTFYDAPVVQDVFKREAYMGFHGIPQVPLFFYHAVHDELTDIENVEKLFQRYCSVGVDVLFERNSVGGHLAEETNGDARALKWLERVLRGEDEGAGKGCVVRDVAVNITDSPV